MRTIYLPLVRLINYYIEERIQRQQVMNRFLGVNPDKVPYIISIAGSVAVGKALQHVFCNRYFPNGQNVVKWI